MTVEETLRRFEDLPFPAEVELGSLVMTIGEIFDLREGAVLRTGRAAGAPVELHIGGVPVAAADVVVLDDSLSIRITRVMESKKSSAGDGIG